MRCQRHHLHRARLPYALTEVEYHLSVTRRHQRPQHDTERRTALEPLAYLADNAEVLESEIAIGIGASNRAHEGPLLEISEVVLPDRRVPVANLTQTVILPVQRLDRRQPAEATEILLWQNADATRGGGIDLFRSLQFDTLSGPQRHGVVGARRCTARPDDQHCRASRHIAGRDATEPLDDLTRFAASDRRQLASENDDVTVKRGILGVGFVRGGLPHCSTLAARSDSPAAFDERGIPPGAALDIYSAGSNSSRCCAER